ncbi:phasin family protein [Paraburkholderia sp. EG286B]|uniref:phasin family protein n=1 Tax=Paraburkholderia sp. EG286B TaxID=3237011 RepID=UPI0034D1943F
MSSPEKQSFATAAACTAAFPILAGHLVAGFSELARLNLSMHAAVLAVAQNRHESLLRSQSPDTLAGNQAGTMPPFAAQFVEHTSAMMDMTLQTSAALNRLFLDGYVEAVRHATATVAAIATSLKVTDAVVKSPGLDPADTRCAVTAQPAAALQDSMRKHADSGESVSATGRKRRSPSR